MSIQTAMEYSPRPRERYIRDILAAFTDVRQKRNEKSLRVRRSNPALFLLI